MDDSGDISGGVISVTNTTLTVSRRLHLSSQVPITPTGTSVNRKFHWPTLPRSSSWTRTGFIKKRIRFQDSRLRMWRRSCLRKKNQIKTSSYIAPVYPVSRYTGFFIPYWQTVSVTKLIYLRTSFCPADFLSFDFLHIIYIFNIYRKLIS